ncbi:MAG: hypothetical protein A3F41_00950, partial [Coxiella sp. RIFCSPHIGHO2_12_FULL_44_14]
MKHKVLIVIIAVLANYAFAAEDVHLDREVEQLRRQSMALQAQLNQIKKQLAVQRQKKWSQANQAAQHQRAVTKPVRRVKTPLVKGSTSTLTSTPTASAVPKHRWIKNLKEKQRPYHSSLVSVHSIDKHPESVEFYPTALMADEHVVTFIAGTPIVSVPYLGARPSFSGSDRIVNISSINRDIRLMEQRRTLYRAYARIGDPVPNQPIIALSGKIEPLVSFNDPYYGNSSGDLNLGSTELDVAAALNDKVEGFIGIVYDDAPPSIGGQRVSNSAFSLSLGFINIGDLDRTPFYFTAGQLYAPFGRYSSSMVSATLPMLVARTLTRPFILGYKTQEGSGPYAAIYGFKSDTDLSNSTAGGGNLGYIIENHKGTADFGVGFIATIADALGMQSNNADIGLFGGFASPTNGNETIRKTPGIDFHGNVSVDRYNITAEWLEATQSFRAQDLSFNGLGARPRAGQVEGSVTFMLFNKPSSVGAGYQWTQQALALNLPAQRALGVFNISIWKDTVESLEYRHDIDYNTNQTANGASAPSQALPNAPT